MSECTRRGFCAVAAGGALASNLIQIGCGNDVQAAPLVPFKIGLFAVSQGIISFPDPSAHTLKDFPDITPIGGAVTLAYPSPNNTLVIHLPNDAMGNPSYVAMQSACPHAQCPLGFNVKDMLVECPCHGSRFTTDGMVQHAPALAAPPLYSVKVVTDPTTNEALTLIIDTNGCTVDKTFNFSDYPDLQVVGGSTVLMPAMTMCTSPIIVVRKSQTELDALDAICTHAGCTVAYSPGNGDLECPCHGSRYSLDGSVLAPPSTIPLRKFTATIDSTGTTFHITSM
jgi:Rieske Fe-S protein